MRGTFVVTDVVEISQYWQAGPPKSLIADSLQVDVKTVLTETSARFEQYVGDIVYAPVGGWCATPDVPACPGG